jgi:hypothetical protein
MDHVCIHNETEYTRYRARSLPNDHFVDSRAETIDIYNGLGADGPAGTSTLSLLVLLGITSLDLPMPGIGERRPDLGRLAGIIDRCLIKDRAHRTRDADVL